VDGKFISVDTGVMISDGRILKGYTLGNVRLPVISKDGREIQITFTDVLYMPLLSIKLISKRLLRSKKVYYSSEEFALYNRDSRGNTSYLMDLKELYGLPYLVLTESYRPRANTSVMIASNKTSEPSPIPSALLNSRLPPTSTGTAKLWHARLGYITDRTLNKLNADRVIIQGNYIYSRYDTYSQGKFKKKRSRI
jgi:hypothetical protein